MATPVIDQFHGDTSLLHLYAALEDHPAALQAVKTAAFDPSEEESLPSRAFAWEDERRFPVHSREHTIASIAYRAKFAAHVPAAVDEKLSDAAEAYGIAPDLFAPAPGSQKIAAAPIEPDYALPEHRRLPVGSPEQTKVAEAVLLRDGHLLPLETRISAFMKVAEAAQGYGLPLSVEARSYAAKNACNVGLLRDRVGMRAARTKVAACAAAYDELDAALARQPSVIVDQVTLMKLAARLHDLDEAAGLVRDYDRRIFDPMKSVFNEPNVKTAQPGEYTSDGMDTTALMNLPPEVWEQVDAPEVAQIAASGDVAQFKQVYETLPMDIKLILRRQMGQ